MSTVIRVNAHTLTLSHTKTHNHTLSLSLSLSLMHTHAHDAQRRTHNEGHKKGEGEGERRREKERGERGALETKKMYYRSMCGRLPPLPRPSGIFHFPCPPPAAAVTGADDCVEECLGECVPVPRAGCVGGGDGAAGGRRDAEGMRHVCVVCVFVRSRDAR